VAMPCCTASTGIPRRDQRAGVLSGVQMPRMNSLIERWIQACRHDLLDRPHVAMEPGTVEPGTICCAPYASTNSSTTLTDPTADYRTPDLYIRYPNRSPAQPRSSIFISVGVIAWVESSTSTSMPLDLRGRGSRHPHRTTPVRSSTRRVRTASGLPRRAWRAVAPGLGVWLIDGEPAGLGIRETADLVTDNLSHFVPHTIDDTG
jgi:hypothetical protein